MDIFFNINLETIGLIINSMMAISTLFLAVATIKSAIITQKIVDSQYAPYIIIYITLYDRPTRSFALVIENVGTDAAFDLRFTIPDYFPYRAKGIDPKNAPMPPNMESGPLRNGMKLLAPKMKREEMLGQYGGLIKALRERSIDIGVSYKNARGTVFTKVYPIDIHDFDYLRWLPNGEERKITALNAIAASLTNIDKNVIPKVSSKDADDILFWGMLALELLDPVDRLEQLDGIIAQLGASQEQVAAARKWMLRELAEVADRNPAAKRIVERAAADEEEAGEEALSS